MPEPLWATLMAIAVMETLEFSWLADIEEGLTIVDKARQWAAKQAAALFGEPGCERRKTASLYSADSQRRKLDRLASSAGRSGRSGGGEGEEGGGRKQGYLAQLLDSLLRDADEEAEVKARALRQRGVARRRRGRGGAVARA